VIRILGKNRLVEDLRGDDFDALRANFAKTNGLVGVRNQITRTRMIFHYAYKAGLIDRPVCFGANFSKPSAKAIRKGRIPRMFEADEIHKMLRDAGPVFRAMILLGVNCGFGPAEIGRLPKSALDLQAGWVVFPRPKTGSERRIPLWPETVEAVHEALAVRPEPTSDDDEGLVFLTRNRGSWFKDSTRYLTERFGKFLRSTGLYRHGRGFYALRHVFETIGGESGDQIAVDAIMGHERGDMGGYYRERVSDKRLQAVVDVVHEWLFSTPAEEADAEPVVVRFHPAK
jgi:integrase